MMTTTFSKLLSFGMMVLLFSCTGTKKEEPTEVPVVPTDTAITMKAAPEPVFVPFDLAEIEHTVKDYDKWRPFFNADSSVRKSNGLEDIVVGRGIDKANNLVIAMKVNDLAKARAFSADPKLKEVMNKAGVTSKPAIGFFHVLRFDSKQDEKQWVLVTHKVKDFDAWLKVFDNEGSANRASQGLYDVVLARGIDDSSLVHLVFDIKDMARAKASLLSEEKKKLMMSAGVEGVPKIEFYSTAE